MEGHVCSLVSGVIIVSTDVDSSRVAMTSWTASKTGRAGALICVLGRRGARLAIALVPPSGPVNPDEPGRLSNGLARSRFRQDV